MLKWRLDEETAQNNRVADFVAAACEEIAKDIDTACPGHTLICSGGPYRGADISTKYNVDKKELGVDIYSIIRMDSSRLVPAIDYAKGICKEACLTRIHLEKKYPKTWKKQYEKWRAGMWKLSGEEQMDLLKELIKNREKDR